MASGTSSARTTAATAMAAPLLRPVVVLMQVGDVADAVAGSTKLRCSSPVTDASRSTIVVVVGAEVVARTEHRVEGRRVVDDLLGRVDVAVAARRAAGARPCDCAGTGSGATPSPDRPRPGVRRHRRTARCRHRSPCGRARTGTRRSWPRGTDRAARRSTCHRGGVRRSVRALATSDEDAAVRLTGEPIAQQRFLTGEKTSRGCGAPVPGTGGGPATAVVVVPTHTSDATSAARTATAPPRLHDRPPDIAAIYSPAATVVPRGRTTHSPRYVPKLQ